METLPDELLCLIFNHLHKIDLFYSFQNLNQRFQRIIVPYLYSIDLTQETISYKHFLIFLQEILPQHGHLIRSFKLDNQRQLKLILPYIHHLTRLQSFTLNIDPPTHHVDECLKKILSINSSLQSLSILNIPQSLENISSFIKQALTSLTLFYQSDLNCCYRTPKIPFIRCLTISITYLNTIAQLSQKLINLEQLNLSIMSNRDLINVPFFEVPNTLLILKLEYRCFNRDSDNINSENLEKILNIFKNINTLILIIFNGYRDLSNYDYFQHLINDFVHLQTFEYYIETQYQPDDRFMNIENHPFPNYTASTLSQSRSQSRIPYECQANFLTLRDFQELLQCTKLDVHLNRYYITFPSSEFHDQVQFNNLNTIIFNAQNGISYPQIMQHLISVINQAPNLHIIDCYGNDLRGIKEFLQTMFLSKTSAKKITHLKLIMDRYSGDYYTEFLNDLSTIFPNLKFLQFPCVEKFISTNPTTLAEVIENLRKSFHKLTHFKLRINSGNDPKQNPFQTYKRCFKKEQNLHKSLFYKVKRETYWPFGYSFHIWL
ncbi:hypothetical protein I4U23_023100 [Adineta vaga]|nr:hypothetical protein I4U23_023100 [Adineta vaga]